MNKEYPLEKILWLDHHSIAEGWLTLEEAIEGGKCLKMAASIGYLIFENKEVVILVQTVSDEFVNCCQCIAKKLIVSREKLVTKSK